MNFYKNGNSVISTIGVLDLPEITKEEFDAEMKRVQEEAEKVPAKPAPTMEERLQAVESEMDDLSYILTGEVLNNAQS